MVNCSWATLVRVLRPHQYCTIVLPTVEGSVVNVKTCWNSRSGSKRNLPKTWNQCKKTSRKRSNRIRRILVSTNCM